ncbi:hypothetical protein BHE74_00002926 [Ensete ventricosum]|nr:hypothetical protein BHE74_00002926 [Ensete ventricosum]
MGPTSFPPVSTRVGDEQLEQVANPGSSTTSSTVNRCRPMAPSEALRTLVHVSMPNHERIVELLPRRHNRTELAEPTVSSYLKALSEPNPDGASSGLRLLSLSCLAEAAGNILLSEHCFSSITNHRSTAASLQAPAVVERLDRSSLFCSFLSSRARPTSAAPLRPRRSLFYSSLLCSFLTFSVYTQNRGIHC